MNAASILLAIAALAGVLALVLLAGRLARAGGLARTPPGAGAHLAIVQTLALDPRRRLHLIRCEQRHALLLTGGGNDQVIGWLDPAP